MQNVLIIALYALLINLGLEWLTADTANYLQALKTTCAQTCAVLAYYLVFVDKVHTVASNSNG